jgi:hypothetical protein
MLHTQRYTLPVTLALWCERVSAAAGNVMSTGVEGEWGRNSDNIRFGCVAKRLLVRRRLGAALLA